MWRGACSLRRAVCAVLVRSGRKPGVEVVEDRFDGWPQLVGDLVLALALAGAASGLGDDDLEDAGEPSTCPGRDLPGQLDGLLRTSLPGKTVTG
jgi:hypothetical protein